MQVNYEAVHAVADKLMSFANAMQQGYIKNWKAHSMCVTIAQFTEAGAGMKGERLRKYVRSCLEMEGFLGNDCDTIAEWIELNLINSVAA